LLKRSGAFQGGDLPGEAHEHDLILFAERAGHIAVHVQHSQNLVAQPNGHG